MGIGLLQDAPWQMVFKAPPNPNHSVIAPFHEPGVVFSHLYHLNSFEFQLPSHSLVTLSHWVLLQLSTEFCLRDFVDVAPGDMAVLG